MNPLFSVLDTQPSMDLKANGEVSRMRSHKGNMPSLPQTKYCPLCPAKFTRTTHLNRHLRSHTNERLHRCNICHAEFTRSDLLTRHKRTCGDNVNANRSRRKSCQACAESKVKCNLHYPCSKCTSRGRECIFVNDPEASRNKKNASQRKSCLANPSSGTTSPATSSSPSGLFAASLTSSPSPFPSSLNPCTPISHLLSLPLASPVPSLSVSSGSSSTSSLHSSPRSEFWDNQLDSTGTFDLMFDNFSLDAHINSSFGDDMINSFMDQPFDSCLAPQSAAETSDFGGWLDASGLESSGLWPAFCDEPQFTFSPNHDDQGFTHFDSLATTDSIVNISPRLSAHQTSSLDPVISPVSFFDAPAVQFSPQGSLSMDSKHYLYLFFSEFCKQIPIVHQATWTMEDKPQTLVRAMQACGALFVKTTAAASFIEETLAMRDSLIQEFAKCTSDLGEQKNLILTVVLLQTIGLFHPKSDQRISSNVYHGMLVMMIRRTGLISRVGAWTPPDLSDVQSIDAAWREWTNYETIKRVLFLSYLHDCYHCMYFSLAPSFQPSEIDMYLPCDNALWSASNSREWCTAVQAPSAYGTGSSRITGFSMKRALAILDDTSFSTVSLSLNPFAHFILIHTVLRNIYASQTDSPSGDASPKRATSTSADDSFAMQYALHNWLQIWLNSPEAMQMDQRSEEPPFVYDALPFYWFAQASLLAIQDGNAIFGDGKFEGRFRLMKAWLDHIKTFLRSENQVPTHLWEELMKIRMEVSAQTGLAGNEHSTGLLALFSGN